MAFNQEQWVLQKLNALVSAGMQARIIGTKGRGVSGKGVKLEELVCGNWRVYLHTQRIISRLIQKHCIRHA